MKKFIIFWLIGLFHFGVSVLVVAISMSALTGADPAPGEPAFGIRMLVAATRVLHFPIVTLAWYSRQWFPGNWIYVPILANSFIWAGGICGVLILIRRLWVKSNE
jgi:hypothetical protein